MTRRYLILSLFAIAATVLYTLFRYPALPETIAIHWGPSGRPDGFSGKLVGALLMPAAQLFMLGLLYGLAAIPSERMRLLRSGPVYGQTVLGTVAFLGLMQVLVLEAAMGRDIVLRGTMVAMWAFFLFLGRAMGKIAPNGLMGIRTKRTLSNPEVWRRTHEWAGRFMVWTAAAGLLLALAGANIWVQMGLILVWAFGPLVYSARVPVSPAL